MNRINIIILIYLVFGGILFAQNEVQDMNVIKCNSNYIYATGTSLTSIEEASQNAKDLLSAEIEDWLKKYAESDIAGYIAKSQEQLGFIKTKRGNLFRVFAYVNKADILPYYKNETVICDSFNKTTDSINTNTSRNEKIEIQDTTKSPPTPINEFKETTITGPQYTPSEKEKELLTIKTFLELNDYINKGRANKSIAQLGKYSTLPNEGLIYVFIHNREGYIPACLKIENNITINLSTGKNDKITNYKGCGAIWITFK